MKWIEAYQSHIDVSSVRPPRDDVKDEEDANPQAWHHE